MNRLATLGEVSGPVLDLTLEGQLRATSPLAPRQPDRRLVVRLVGDMSGYRWGIEADRPLAVEPEERVELTVTNTTMMAHPMHLHGHHFQVAAIEGRRFAGAVRDTVLVPPMQSVVLAFDTGNPGNWAFHCHHLYHMAATGMMTTLACRN